MNIKEFKKVFPILRKHNIVPFLHGSQGVGKTQTVEQCAREHNLGFVHLHLATQEVGDLVGLLKHGDDGSVYHARPEWFPTEGQGIIFLDEINRAHPEVLQAMFSFITKKTMHRHTLPDGWSIVAAGNYQNDQFNVTDMSDAAWLSRFCHLDFRPTPEEFILFAEDKNAFDVAGFVRENNLMLESKVKDGLNLSFITPDRRAWMTMIAPLDTEESIENERFELYQGCIGTSAASSYIAYKAKQEKAISAKQILVEYPKVRNKVTELSGVKDGVSRLDSLNKTVEEVMERIKQDGGILKDQKTLENISAFVLDLPAELSLKFFHDLGKLDGYEKFILLNNKDLCDKIKVKLESSKTKAKKK